MFRHVGKSRGLKALLVTCWKKSGGWGGAAGCMVPYIRFLAFWREKLKIFRFW